MHINILTISCLFFASTLFAGWEERLNKLEDGHVLRRQFQAFKESALPKMTAPQIKGIPIEECGEEFIDIRAAGHPRIQLLPIPTAPYVSPDHSAGFDETGRVRCGLYESLERLILNLDESAEQFGLKPGKIQIRVFEGLRNLANQQKLFDQKAGEIQKVNPGFTEDQVFEETSKWVSATKDNVPVHSTGGAVDLRLFNEEANDFLDMGSFGVIWGPNPLAPTFSAGLTEEQEKNRFFLLQATNKAGLVNYPYEWWHFSRGDRYAAYWLQADPSVAIYGAQ